MFFALVVLPIVAGTITTLSNLKTQHRNKKKWQSEASDLQEEFGDLVKRRVVTINVALTKEEAEAFEESSAGKFLQARQVSDEAAQHLKERRA